MPKLSNTGSMVILNDRHDYMCRVRTPYVPGINIDLGCGVDRLGMPGAKWNANDKSWSYPIEGFAYLQSVARKYGFSFQDKRDGQYQRYIEVSGFNPALKEYQSEAVLKALRTRRLMINFETGLGKTLTAIECLRLCESRSVLIICPANVRLTWVDELNKWAPTCPEIQVIDTGEQAAEAELDFKTTIVSFELAQKINVEDQASHLDAIVVDESHYYKEGATKRTTWAQDLFQSNPKALKLLLTATAICNEPKDLYAQLNLLCPGRYGSYWNFNDAYSIRSENEYGVSYYGANPDRADELARRLEHVSVRVTKSQVASLLSPCSSRSIRIRARGKRLTHKALIAALESRNKDVLDATVLDLGQLKFKAVISQVEEDLELGYNKVVVLTHERKTVEQYVDALSTRLKTVAVTGVTGDLGTKSRFKTLEEGAQLDRHVLVCTMHSIAEGLNMLTPYNRVNYAELYWQPKVLIQSAGRFWRLTSKEPVELRFFVLEDSLDEVIMQSISRKLDAMGQLIVAGEAEKKLSEGLGNTEESDIDALRRAAASFVGAGEEHE